LPFLSDIPVIGAASGTADHNVGVRLPQQAILETTPRLGRARDQSFDHNSQRKSA
jgi:hypothetical protein